MTYFLSKVLNISAESMLETIHLENDLVPILPDIFAFAPELFYEVREFLNLLREKKPEDYAVLNIESIPKHMIYHEHLDDMDYVLTHEDNVAIVDSIVTNYNTPELVRGKLQNMPPEALVDYLSTHGTIEIILLFSSIFSINYYALETLYKKHSLLNVEILANLISLIKIGATYPKYETMMIDEMGQAAGSDLFELIKFKTVRESGHPYLKSPSHFKAYILEHADEKEKLFNTEMDEQFAAAIAKK